MITTGVAYHLGAGQASDFGPVLNTILGTGVATAGALALNQWAERDRDARMKRTKDRPLPSGRLGAGEALAFGFALVAAGVAYLAWSVGWLPAALTFASAAAYVLAYTPLKTRTYFATLVGAVPGAFPALIGWSAATGGLALEAWVLFAIYFLWQLPHVLALAWLLRDDYQRAGFFMAPPTDPDGGRIGRHMVYHTISLILVSAAPTPLGLTGNVYLVGALLLGLAMLAVCVHAARHMSQKNARRVFLWSLLYQPLLLGLMLIDAAGGR
ncbi:MAG: protoheme IX farnesyltransferase [Gemmatimonadetes bacterium]|nr:MAG: protoheme IX farnesyltransferase [Gemmatimonadota bacterium]